MTSREWDDSRQGMAPEDAVGYQEESIDGVPEAARSEAWQRMLDRHMDGRVCFDVPAPPISAAGGLQGRLRSGVVGPLRYYRLWINSGRQSLRFSVQPDDHQVALLLAGGVRLRQGRKTVDVRAGDFVLINPVGRVIGEHLGPIETLILDRPLESADHVRFSHGSLLLRRSRSDFAALLTRWLQDACADRGLSPESAVLVGQTLRTLVRDVLHEAPPEPTPRRLTRTAIELRIAECLGAQDLGPQSLADRLGCSVRTLHRTFQRDGEESIERFIQRRRLEACADALRGLPSNETGVSLTRLAMAFGFASASHFSTAFRRHFGVTPSEYRARFDGAAGARIEFPE